MSWLCVALEEIQTPQIILMLSKEKKKRSMSQNLKETNNLENFSWLGH